MQIAGIVIVDAPAGPTTDRDATPLCWGDAISASECGFLFSAGTTQRAVTQLTQGQKERRAP